MGAGQDEGTKEFAASQSKLRQLREQGNVPKSAELNQLLPFLLAVSFLLMAGDYLWSHIYDMFQAIYGAFAEGTLDEIGGGFIIEHSFKVFFLVIAPLLLLSSLGGILGDLLQVGIMFTTSQLGIKLNKINPATYFKNLFSIKKVVEFLKQLGKVLILVGLAYFVVKDKFPQIIMLAHAETVSAVVHILKDVISDFVIKAMVLLLIVAIVDFSFQRFQFLQENRMTRKEMMDEFKKNEGDPQMKQKRKQIAKQISQGQQIASIAEADFVTTNPFKLAVAIKYKSGKMLAPMVLAKGADAFAWRIIHTAKEHKVPVIENIPLARALYKLGRIGKEIPPQLYKAVAEVLLFAYQIRGKASTVAS